jgi:DNA-directed RNA polymerase subunit RPC12/RpoP
MTEKPYLSHKICSKCGLKYGTDFKEDNGLCPLCSRQIYKRKSNRVKRIWERMKERKR